MLRRADQTAWIALLLALCAALPMWRPEVAHAQALCPQASYSEHALSFELLAGAQVRRVGLPVLFAHESGCVRAELGKHWAQLRLSHAFGDAQLPGRSQRRIEHSVRLWPEYRFLLRPVADTGALRLSGSLHVEHDPLRGFEQRVQGAAAVQLSLVDDYDIRAGFSLGYFVGGARRVGESRSAHQSGLWLTAEVGVSPRDGVLLGQELLLQVPFEGQGALKPRLLLQSTLRVGGPRVAIDTAVCIGVDRQAPAGFAGWDALLRSGVVLML